MLDKPSFLAEKVAPSTSENISRAICFGDRSAWPSSLSLMNQAFSANRQASKKKGRPWRSQTSRTARRFANETG